MVSQRPEYRESLYQWIWKELEFDYRNLETVCGRPVRIISQGRINHGAGPDFLDARVRIGGLNWAGAVEIHKKSSDWNSHGHDKNPGFNKVFLHVVFRDDAVPVSSQSGPVPFTLNLRPYLRKSLHQLADNKNESTLLCGGNVTFLNQQAFLKQVEKAHKEYLGFKVDELLSDYPAGVPLSLAWKECFIIRMYDTLGIPANRTQMRRLAKNLFQMSKDFSNAGEFADYAIEVAFSGSHREGINWNTSGMRPASRPEKRIRQAAHLHHVIEHTPFSIFLENHTGWWKDLCNSIPASQIPGAQMSGIIRQTVFIPAIYLLGDLLHAKPLKESAFLEWMSSRAALPDEVKTPFLKAGFDLSENKKMLGLAHQYKRYCTERNCHRCEVFKNAIGS